MKMIRVVPNSEKIKHNRKMWVKEKNPYFKWYRENPAFKVTKEIEVSR